jgi:hypothetical protein
MEVMAQVRVKGIAGEMRAGNRITDRMNIGLFELNINSEGKMSGRFGSGGIDLTGFAYNFGTNITASDWYNAVEFAKERSE